MSARDDAVYFAENQLLLMRAMRRVLDAYEYGERDAARMEAEKLLRSMDTPEALEAYIEREAA